MNDVRKSSPAPYVKHVSADESHSLNGFCFRSFLRTQLSNKEAEFIPSPFSLSFFYDPMVFHTCAIKH